MKNKIKGLLALALAAFTGGLWAGVTSSFGVNFRTAEAQDIPADTAAGFAKGDYTQPTTWVNLNGGNSKQDITAGDATLNVTWYSRGTWNSEADTSTLDGKLLFNFLDDTVNSGRQKAAVKITGLPADKRYAVAILLSGDADNDGFNGKYSPVWMNGQIYSYDANATLLTGEAAVAATTWGSRRKPSAGGPSTFTEGMNVMFVEGVTGSELTITSAMDSQGVSRLTIAGVQVWVTDTTVTAPAVTAPTDSDVISVNFHSGDGAAADGDGLVVAKHWHNTTGMTGTIDSLTVVNGDDSVASSGTLTYKASTNWGYGTNVTDAFLKGYLDDGAHDGVSGATITAKVPFEEYSVVVYMATDTEGQFKPVIVNGTLYAGSATLSSVGYAEAKPSMMQNTSICNWGTCQTATAAYGVNALRVDGLSGDLSIQAGSSQTYNGIRNRGGIAAIQIVNTGDSILANVQKIDWSDKPAEELKVSELPELTKPEVVLTLPAGATLIVDTALPADHSFVIVGDNATVHITNWDIDKFAVDAVVSGATVTTAYTDTIGVEIDGVIYSYYFRGTTDANYGTVANWYTGKRVMGDQTKWYSVSGDAAPGVGGNMWHYMLLDGDMMDPTNVTVGEDGYKTISASVLEGWNLGYFVRNGVHLNVSTLNKIQNGGGFTAVWRVDDTSKITIGARGNSSHNNLANYYIDNEEGMVFTEFDIADANYYFDEDGSVKLDGVSGTQTIKAIKLDLGTVAEGRKVVSRKVIGFNSSTATYTVEEGAVTTSVETVAATEAVSLQTVGDYKFEQKNDGYYVSFVAYAATDEIGEASTWTATEDTTWATEANWTFGIPAAGADAVILITADTTITIPAEGVTVGALTVNGEGTLTIAGGKLTAGKIYANASITADETTLALAPMNIAEGKTVTYATTTYVANGDDIGETHALTLKDVTGAGTFVKDGTGTMAFFYDAADVTTPIVVNAGDLKVRGANGDQNVKLNVTVKKDALLSLAAWKAAFINDANSIKLEGGAQLWLINGAALAGTITIANAAETPAKICGQSFSAATISAAITGAGKVEFADGGAFNPTYTDNIYPCQYATTYSGVISGELQVIISDTSDVTFTGANTYTGGTVIAEGVTVTVSDLTSIFGTGAITGAGTVKIAGGSYNGLSFAQYTDANTTILIPADNTVTGYFNNATWTCAAKIQLDGALDMTNGFGAGKYTFTGPWAGAGAFSLSNAAPADVVRITGDISDFTGNISIAGARALTFCAATTGTNQKYAGKICVHGDYAYTAKVNGTWSAPVMVENGAKIGGAGTIDNTLTFANGAIIDTSITATGDVTLNGTVTVSGEAGAIVLTCANAESLDLTKFAAPTGLKCVADGNTVKLAAKKTNFVVTVGENAVNCETFAEALTVLGSAGGSLQIAADADEAALAITEPIVITADAVIDLNGKTITGAAYPVIRIQNGANVTIKNGTITNNDYVFVLGASDQTSAGNLTIESGTYTGVTTVASVTKGTLTITGGTFSVSEVDYGATYLLNCVDANYKAGTATIVVTGGAFKGFNPANNTSEGANTNFCAEGYEATEGEDGYWTVAAIPVSNNVAKIGETEYETLELAFDAAANMTAPVTVTLLKDVGSEEEAAPVVSIPQGFNGTLDLDGKTLYSRIEAPKAMVALTIKNGKILHRTGSAAAIDIKVSGLLTLDDVYLETSYHGVRLRKNAKGVINSGDYRLVATSSSSSYNLLYLSDAPASGDSASLVINGGDFYSRYMDTPYVMIRALIGEVVINDGVFHAILPGTTSQTWCIASETGRPIYINGGDFSEFSKERIFKTGQNASVKEVYYTGGMFSFDPVADATADLHLGQMEAGYHAVMLEGDDFYTVVEKPAIQLTIDLGDGVSKVDYTIAGNTTTITEDTTIDIAESGTVVSFAVVADDGYFAPTVADVTVTETTTVPIAGVAFSAVESADAAITADNRDAVYAWAKSNGKSQSEVSAANYLYADYLFNFAEFSAAEPTIEITEFTADPLVIKAKVTVNGETKIADLSATGLNLNGTLKYKAAATLEALEDATPKAALDATDRFFKVVVE